MPTTAALSSSSFGLEALEQVLHKHGFTRNGREYEKLALLPDDEMKHVTVLILGGPDTEEGLHACVRRSDRLSADGRYFTIRSIWESHIEISGPLPPSVLDRVLSLLADFFPLTSAAKPCCMDVSGGQVDLHTGEYRRANP